mgnify:CR=1 FL=1
MLRALKPCNDNMDITIEQLSANLDGFRQIADSGAFQTLESYYNDTFLQGSHGQPLEALGQNYLYQSGAISVFRMIKELASGMDAQVGDFFEDELLEDDTNTLLD